MNYELIKQIRSRDTCKINYKHIIFSLCTVIFIIYFIWTKLEINYLVPSFNGLVSFKDDLDNKSLNNGKNSSDCKPFLSDSGEYSVVIDGIRYPKSLSLYMNASINFACLRESKRVKRILAWNGFFGDYTYAQALKSSCPVTNCELISNKSLVNSSDMVIVHMRDPISNIPEYRPQFQRWVFVLYESPIHSGDFSRYNRLFNLTSTYKIDSNFSGFYENYSLMQWKFNTSFNESYDFYKSKLKFAVAVISNCGASSRRLDYIKEMQNHVSVDVYGKCGNNCPTSFVDSTPGNCKDILGREYKFYLAFENSICQDYITEKFFDILKYDIIPVTLGGGIYDHYIPKSGFIDVRNFASPKHLAEYLTYLDTNRTAYNSYFKWKKHVVFRKEIPSFSPICDMCIKLNLEEFIGIEQSIIEDIGAYWNKKLNCKSAKLDTLKTFTIDNI